MPDKMRCAFVFTSPHGLHASMSQDEIFPRLSSKEVLANSLSSPHYFISLSHVTQENWKFPAPHLIWKLFLNIVSEPTWTKYGIYRLVRGYWYSASHHSKSCTCIYSKHFPSLRLRSSSQHLQLVAIMEGAFTFRQYREFKEKRVLLFMLLETDMCYSNGITCL